MKYSFLIIDDEPFARKLIASHCSKIEGLQLKGECSNAIEASAFLRNNPVDLLFLDVQMPELSGLDFIKTLVHPPAIILTTAYRDFALEAFELDVMDYLLKPVSFERLLRATNKFFDRKKPAAAPSAPVEPPQQEDFLYVKSNRKMYKVVLDEIVYVESLDDYVKVYIIDKVIITRENISSLENKLPADRFIRTHRSFLVSVKKITSYSADGIEVGKKLLPFGRAYKQKAMELLGG